MTHLWLRAEHRAHEQRSGLTPDGARRLIAAGMRITVEDSAQRVFATQDYAAAGCEIAPEHSWPQAPADAVIFGLKELPEDDSPLRHCHVMFGHAFKGQHAGRALLRRFRAGGGTLLDLEYLTDDTGRRLAAFGYWAGYAGAALALKCWAAQQRGEICGPVGVYAQKEALLEELGAELGRQPRPDVLVIGALGRVGTGAGDLAEATGCAVTRWDMAETARGGPFPEILKHPVFVNCIFARPGTPVFVGPDDVTRPRALRVIGDVACDPDSDYNPIPLYDAATTWKQPALRVHEAPPLDIMAIDNLPSMLPRESSQDYAGQLWDVLARLGDADDPVWSRAEAEFDRHVALA